MSNQFSPYFVVFEYNNRQSGHSGVRFWKQFSGKNDPNIKSYKNNYGKIVVEGISEVEAISIVALTPEACYLSDAIQSVIRYSELFDPEFTVIANYLNLAYQNIVINREVRLKYHLTPSTPFLEVFVDYRDSATDKLYSRVVNTMTMDINGNIGALDRVIPGLADILLSLSIDKQLEKHTPGINTLYCPI